MCKREAEWTYRLSPAQVAELDAAVRAVQARWLNLADVRRADFPLPTLGPVLDRLRVEVLDGRGFAFLRGLPVEDRPIADSAMAYWGIGSYFGGARSQNAQGHLLGHVYDLGKGLSATNPHLRSYATTERQNFHIDRCDVVALLCLQRAKSGAFVDRQLDDRATTSWRSAGPIYWGVCTSPFRSTGVARCRRARPRSTKRWCSIRIAAMSVLYSRLHIGSAQRFPEARRLTVKDVEALDMLAELAGNPELRLDMNFMPGDIQFLHNHTILHARSAYEDWPEPERKRHLLRLWQSPPGARPLPPVFAECYGSIAIGDRGGIICAGTRPHAPLTPG